MVRLRSCKSCVCSKFGLLVTLVFQYLRHRCLELLLRWRPHDHTFVLPISHTEMQLHRLRPVMRACCFLVYSSFAKPAATQNACTYSQQVVTKVLVVENPIYINTNVLWNTTFAVNPYLTLTVDDAPTSVDLRTTYTMRKTTIIDRVYSSVASSSSVQKEAQFVLIIGNSRLSHNRRQAGGTYLGSNGLLTTSCANASAYSLVNGQLFATTSNGAKLQFSASTGNNYITFVPTANPGDITTTFSLTTTGILLWTNSNFFNGNALFCILPSGEILAIFVQNSQPDGCVFIDLTISDCKSFIPLYTWRLPSTQFVLF